MRIGAVEPVDVIPGGLEIARLDRDEAGKGAGVQRGCSAIRPPIEQPARIGRSRPSARATASTVSM
jgi:hypothetical protein